MTFRSFATVVALTTLAPLALVAQPKTTTVKFGTKLLSHTGRLDGPALSPDGKWLIATSMSASDLVLMIAPATGGSFRLLVPAADRARQLTWFPSGDRVAFMSDRVGGVVVSDFDATTGTLRGAPRRVTLERAGQFAISPDGQRLAYDADAGNDRVLKLVSITGGTAQELLRMPANALDHVRFSLDGKSIYFAVRSPAELGSVYRVSIAGGKPELVWRPTQPSGFTLVDPSVDRIVRSTEQTIVFMTLRGDTVLAMPNGGIAPTSSIGVFSASARSMFVTPSDVGTTIRAIPLDGGKAIDVSTNKEYYWPIGWSSDSKTIYFGDDAMKTLFAASLDGTVRRTVPLDPQPRPVNFEDVRITGASGDGRYLFVAERTGNAGRAGLRRAYIYDTQTRALRPLTDSLGASVASRGGRYLPFQHQSGEFLFLQRTGGTAGQLAELPREIRAAKPTGASRLVRRVPSASDSARNFIADGDRVFWTVSRRDTTSLFFARGTEPALKIWSTTERVLEALLSSDGTRMAVAVTRQAENGFDRARFLFLRIDASGKASSAGTSATFGSFWDAYWMPDDKALVALEYPASDLDTRLVRIPSDGGAVSYIVKAGTMTFWDHYLSPNGKYSLLPAESPRGASVWRIDLDAAERDWKQRRGSR